jgi:outer membrane murein-binding lipoprotein Lpp
MVTEDKDDMKEFEEEFDFESDETLHDDLPIDDEDILAPQSNNPNRDTAQAVSIDRKPSKLPWLIGITAVSFIAWQGYKMIFKQPAEEIPPPSTMQEAKKQNLPDTKVQESTHTTTVSTQSHSPLSATLPSQDQPTSVLPSNMATTASTTKSPDLFSPPTVNPSQAQLPGGQMLTTTAVQAPTPPKPGQLDLLEENAKKNQERVGKLESKFSELMDAMGSLNQNMNQVTRELSTINDSVQKLNKEVKLIKADAQPTQPQAAKSLPDEIQTGMKYETKSGGPSQITRESTPNMSVHAIIPGRAWLKSRDGTTITVTEGDSLDRYGKVLVIDASNGVVITSSGVTLR